MMKRPGIALLLAAETPPTRGGNSPHSRRKTILPHWLLRLIERDRRYFSVTLSVTQTSRKAWQGAFLWILSFQGMSEIHPIVTWNNEQGNTAMKGLPRHICLNRISANRCYQIQLEMHHGHIQKRSFLHVSSSARPYRDASTRADGRGRVEG